jgi:twitching motility protein PilT
MLRIDDYLRKLASVGARELFLSSDRPPVYRAASELLPLPGEGIVSDAELRAALQALVGADEWAAWLAEQCLSFVAQPARELRVRGLCTASRHGVTVRLSLVDAGDLAELSPQLPAALAGLIEEPAGLVIVTGPCGGGKTSLIATLLSQIAAQRLCQIVSLEDPIEHLQAGIGTPVAQRAIGRHCLSFARAVDSALETGADVIACSDLMAPGVCERLIEAAGSGVLVFAESCGQGSVHALEQLLVAPPEHQRSQRAIDLADCLLAVTSLDLLPRKSGGRVLAAEVLLATPSVASLLREGKTALLSSLLDREPGMQSMDRCLLELATRGVIEGKDAQQRAGDKRLFASWA